MEINIEEFIKKIKNRNMTIEIDNGYKVNYSTLSKNFEEIKIVLSNLIEDQCPFYLTTQENIHLKISDQKIFKFTCIHYNGFDYKILSEKEITDKNKIILKPKNFLITKFDYI